MIEGENGPLSQRSVFVLLSLANLPIVLIEKETRLGCSANAHLLYWLAHKKKHKPAI